ncbi:class I SAM-dependent methyltransferase [Mumia zhuanghuii]|uniref:Methyltransferase n=1 Tax=Mumia zhuanghuii TaxID=2585211 RepID=A0A5C4ML94_9ACTN|nr:methyltransferase [Mumia zhuanghuii]TNC31755.1 methyltransferase [Mumia zhuanghuii]TNC46528.1 methyltransferase [Mumia zhuanghuii]
MTEHYFDATPTGPEGRRDVTARIWEHDYVFTTAAGVFARDGLDKATAVLLRTFDPPDHASTVLDLGCGWGPIACAVASEVPGCTVHAVDTNTRALELTRDNAARAGVADRVLATLPGDVPATVTFDEIWSNPPIRIGKEALHELLLGWLPRLSPDGVARLVVGKNLGADSLTRWLTDQGWPTERVTSAKGFRVLLVRRA